MTRTAILNTRGVLRQPGGTTIDFHENSAFLLSDPALRANRMTAE
jgi:hypothetical protein